MKYPVSFELELKEHNLPGKIIAIEGIDGSGKTTQAQRLVEKLKKNGIDAHYTKEPTDGEIGKFIREILSGQKKFEPFAFQYLFVADRVGHQKEMEKMLSEEKVIVSDRFFWSSVAYGGTDRGIDFSKDGADQLLTAFGILSPYHRFMVPDLTIYLRVSIDTAMKRISEGRSNADIYDEHKKLETIAAGYEWLVKKFPDRFEIADANGSIEEVTERLLTIIHPKIKAS